MKGLIISGEIAAEIGNSGLSDGCSVSNRTALLDFWFEITHALGWVPQSRYGNADLYTSDPLRKYVQEKLGNQGTLSSATECIFCVTTQERSAV